MRHDLVIREGVCDAVADGDYGSPIDCSLKMDLFDPLH